jgi:hypothetical protein
VGARWEVVFPGPHYEAESSGLHLRLFVFILSFELEATAGDLFLNVALVEELRFDFLQFAETIFLVDATSSHEDADLRELLGEFDNLFDFNSHLVFVQVGGYLDALGRCCLGNIYLNQQLLCFVERTTIWS